MEVMINQLLLKGVAEDFDDMLDELRGLGKSNNRGFSKKGRIKKQIPENDGKSRC